MYCCPGRIFGVIPNEILNIMHVTGIPTVIGIIGYGFKRSPRCLEVVDLYVGSKSGVSLPEGGSEAIGGMGGEPMTKANLILSIETGFLTLKTNSD